MNRRAFVVALASAALPQAAMAQSRAVRIAVLSLVDPEPYARLFRQGMRDLGYREGQNIIIEVSSAEGKQQQLDQLVAQAVRAKPDVIVTYQTPTVLAAQKATRALP